MTRVSLFLCFCAGLLGAVGVAGAALAVHGQADGMLVGIAAAVALVHAPALLGLAALPASAVRFRALAGVLLVGGTLLFSGALFARALLDQSPFLNAAPTGGTLLIAGWLAVAIGAAVNAFGRRVPI